MATAVDWPSGVITVYQSDMTYLGGVLYQLDVDQLRLELKALESDPDEGMAWPDTHRHNTEVTVGGITVARTVKILSPYTITISPAGNYQVLCINANHNIQDVFNNLAGPTLLPNLSAGLVVRESGTSGLTPEESEILARIRANTNLIPGLF